jgi:hypothetical protein
VIPEVTVSKTSPGVTVAFVAGFTPSDRKAVGSDLDMGAVRCAGETTRRHTRDDKSGVVNKPVGQV